MNGKALSPLVGFALIFASVISIVAVYQTQTVPALIKEQEWEHYQLVKSKFESLDEKIELAAESNGFVLVNIPLQVRLEGVSFTPLPQTSGVVIEAEKIGYVNVTYDDWNISYELVALKLIPRYNYLKAKEELFILGGFFTPEGNLLRGVDGSYQPKIFILDVKDNVSERIVINAVPISGSIGGGKIEIRVTNDKLKDSVVDYLKSLFANLNPEVDEENGIVRVNSTKVPLIVASLYSTEESNVELLKAEDMRFIVSGFSDGGVSVDKTVIENGDVIEVTFLDERNRHERRHGHEESPDSVYIYVIGYTSRFSEEVNVSIYYKGEDEDDDDEDSDEAEEDEEVPVSLNFTWSTLSNGYLQLPIEVFKPKEETNGMCMDESESYTIEVVMLFDGEEEFNFLIKVKTVKTED